MTAKKFRFRERKFRELVLYIADRCKEDPRFGATKLNKILYYADFAAFRRLGEPITGAHYQRLDAGPAPREMVPQRRILLDRGDIDVIEVDYYTGTQQRVVSLKKPDKSVLSEDELAIVEEVVADLWPFDASDVSERSHREPGWRATAEKEDIPYETAWLSSEPLTPEEEKFGRELASDLNARAGRGG